MRSDACRRRPTSPTRRARACHTEEIIIKEGFFLLVLRVAIYLKVAELVRENLELLGLEALIEILERCRANDCAKLRRHIAREAEVDVVTINRYTGGCPVSNSRISRKPS